VRSGPFEQVQRLHEQRAGVDVEPVAAGAAGAGAPVERQAVCGVDVARQTRPRPVRFAV
jgi:hypothetical protein